MADTMQPMAGNARGAAWRSWLGIVAIVLGVLLVAVHGTEWTRQRVFAIAAPASGELPPAECPEDELIEEGLSVAECEQLVSNVRSYLVSAPEWFPGLMTALSAFGTILAFVSIVVGAGLVDHRAWAATVAVPVFGGLALIDAVAFIGAINAGPILRGLYLWNHLQWFVVHMMMTVGAVAGRAASTAEITR